MSERNCLRPEYAGRFAASGPFGQRALHMAQTPQASETTRDLDPSDGAHLEKS